jgi:predicted enzyme related to lactoylglutathione lyase
MNRFGAVLFVKDVSRLTAFYAAVAALPVTETGDSWARLGDGAFELVIHGIPERIAKTFAISTPPERREDAAIKLIFPVASIAGARVTTAQLGGELNPPNREWQLGTLRVCDGHDPEGNVFQVRAAAT